MVPSGLYTKIALRLALLLLLSMVLIDLAVFMAVEKAMVQARIDQGRRFLNAWAAMGDPSGGDAAAVAARAGAVCLTRYDADLVPTAGTGCSMRPPDMSIRGPLAQGKDAIGYRGMTWGLFWPQPQELVVAVSCKNGAAVGVWRLEPVYRVLRRMQPVVAGYMLVNLMLLEIIGLYLFGRITVRPLQRLMRRAETFSDDEDLFLCASRDAYDYGQLSRALNRIYGRMKSDRTQLAAAVDRLETANRDLGKAQQEVLRAEKLAAIGRLSAGLAHEIGNPLGIVSGYLGLLRHDALDAVERGDIVQRAETEIERIGRILRQLLDLARPSPESDEGFDLHALIRETAQIFEYQPLTATITLETTLAADHDRVCANPERLRQVLLNLMINAADAIKARGPDHDGVLKICTENHGDQVHITFSDNGAGIDAVHLPLIFDPFFTTKEPGQGTGLGLAVSYMIVEACGGRMSATSQVGVGTTLKIELPLADGPARGQG